MNTHRITILTNQEQVSQINLFLMEMGVAFSITPIVESTPATESLTTAGNTTPNVVKGLSLRILRSATANGNKGIHRKTIGQLGKNIGVSPQVVSNTLTQLVETGKLTSAGRGVYKRAA